MRLGTSGFGVIAVVSLLVTAAPERKNGVDTERIRISRGHYTGRYRVTTESDGLDDVTTTSFVKKKLARGRDIGETWPEARTSRTSSSSTVRHNDLNVQVPTAGYTTNSPKSEGTSAKPRNFARSVESSKDRTTRGESGPTRTSKNSELVKAVASSSSRNCEEKFHVTLDSPISDFIRIVPTLVVPGSRPRRHGEWKTGMDEGETKSRDDVDKISTTWENGSVRTRGESSSTVESTVTKNHRVRTMTSTSIGRIATGPTRRVSNFIESREDRVARDEFDPVNNKDAIGNDPFVNGRPSMSPIFQLDSRIKHLELEEVSSTSYPTNYHESLVPLRFSTWNEVSLRETRENRDPKAFVSYTKEDDSTKLPSEEYFMRDRATNSPRQESLVLATDENKGSTVRSSIDVTAIRNETVERSSVTEEIDDARQITSGSFVEATEIGTNASRLTGNVGNASDVDNSGSVNNHKVIRVGSFKATERQKPSSSFTSRSSRILERHDVKDSFAHFTKENPGVKTDRTTATVNQIALSKSVTKNSTKQSINLVDGRVNKIFYEIKPSLITDMDRGDDIDVTTTTRRSVDRFLPPSVPSALGKFGPYFLDEEDRRNVTERIGNTVQLDCRIGLLGHRKVTWLQHYKDSFRLLTVERESYSVDRRISLNFQYPDNWRLQIAYASMRDSGLYKCQVEIDHARSLVKRYNVIITAPILTITDDSGRPVSGERHLKAGSALKLRCEARDVVQRLNESVLWMRGDETLTDDVSENKTTEIVNENEVTVVISTLLVERAIPRHAGNYSCVVPDKARTTIAVHVLNGELPAAVQHGSGVSTAVLNLWLIHLTASYGFFR